MYKNFEERQNEKAKKKNFDSQSQQLHDDRNDLNYFSKSENFSNVDNAYYDNETIKKSLINHVIEKDKLENYIKRLKISLQS